MERPASEFVRSHWELVVFLFAIICFIVVATKPSPLPHWQGYADVRYKYTIVVGVTIIVILTLLLVVIGASAFAWLLLMLFSIAPLYPICRLLVAEDTRRTFQAILQHVTLLSPRQEFIWNSLLIGILPVLIFAWARLGIALSTTDGFEGAVTGAGIGITTMSLIMLHYLNDFSSNTLVISANGLPDPIAGSDPNFLGSGAVADGVEMRNTPGGGTGGNGGAGGSGGGGTQIGYTIAAGDPSMQQLNRPMGTRGGRGVTRSLTYDGDDDDDDDDDTNVRSTRLRTTRTLTREIPQTTPASTPQTQITIPTVPQIVNVGPVTIPQQLRVNNVNLARHISIRQLNRQKEHKQRQQQQQEHHDNDRDDNDVEARSTTVHPAGRVFSDQDGNDWMPVHVRTNRKLQHISST